MDAAAAGKSATARKRKIKFSERELEILIEEVVRSHDKIFGKNSLQVPESEKRKIWHRIQRKVNAVGVMHREIDDLKKRWYDLRSRAKERVAKRLKEAGKTGGGQSTMSGTTPMEELVESTILPEAAQGVTQLDTSGAASTSQGKMHATVTLKHFTNVDTSAQSSCSIKIQTPFQVLLITNKCIMGFTGREASL